MSLPISFGKRKGSVRRVAVIGLDGVPHSLIRDLSSKGHLPVITRLMGEGLACAMDSSMPPVSSVAWTSFMTGTNPARHGIFGFSERRPETYSIYFPDASHIRAPTIWDILTQAGKRTVALNIPNTYPARALNGILVSGFVALDIERAVYPGQLADALRKIDYRIDVDCHDAASRKESFFRDLTYTLQRRREVFLAMIGKPAWDLFIGVFTETDRLNHFFWSDYEDQASDYHQQFISYYREIDAIIGELISSIDESTGLLIISDHGFGHLSKEVYLNAWLKQEGLLRLKTAGATSLEDINPGATQAFALDPGRVYINLKGIAPQGCVRPGAEYDQLVRRITSGLQRLQDESSSQKVIDRVYQKKELYSGALIDRAPDLVAWGSTGYDVKGALSKDHVFGNPSFSGMHTYHDAFFYLRRLETLSDRPRLIDIAPTILRLLGLPAVQEFDGKPLV